MDLSCIQAKIREYRGDGWLFCDHHQRDEIAYDILGVDRTKMTTRRWFYFIPRQGTPTKLVHRIEAKRLDELPGEKSIYIGWKDLREKLKEILDGSPRVFMQYSPENNIPMVSLVDAGTVELVRSLGTDVVSSADLVQFFEARIDAAGIAAHRSAGAKIQAIKDSAFALAITSIQAGKVISEYDVQQYILGQFEKQNLTCDGSPPMVGVNAHAADPHFDLTQSNSVRIKEGDRLLIDLWARENTAAGIYYDITWCGFMGHQPDRQYEQLFEIVVKARKLTKDFICERFRVGQPVCGWEADDVCRGYIAEQGYGDYFVHRTGHSIHRHGCHGNGANLDNLETKDDRQLIPGTCFSIEPGIYKGDIGVRSEINVLIDQEGNPSVAGAEQEKLVVFG